MKSVGEFIYKGIEKRSGGEFTNDKGQNIKYNESYILKVDESTEKGIFERRLKIDVNNNYLIDKLKNKKPYESIKLLCDINFFGNNVKVVPVDLYVDSNNK